MAESAGLAVAVVVLTLLFREGVPAVLKLLRGTHEIGREAAADQRAARKEEAADARKDDTAAIKELKEFIGVQRADTQDVRRQNHDLRDSLQVVTNRLNAAEIRAAVCEAQRERDRERLDALEDSLAAAGIRRRPVPPRMPQPPAPEAAGE